MVIFAEFTPITPDLTGIVVLIFFTILFVLNIIAIIHLLRHDFKDHSKKSLWLFALIFTMGIIAIYYLANRKNLIKAEGENT